MMTLGQLRRQREIIDGIDWDMTPEEAVTRYLEWGNNWSHGKNLVRSKKDFSCYFVVNTWDAPPRIQLIRRNSDAAVELAEFDIPEAILQPFLKRTPKRGGVYAPDREIREWLEKELYG